MMDFSKKSMVDWVLSEQSEQRKAVSRTWNFKTVNFFFHGRKGVPLLTHFISVCQA